jgi:septal ring factor EnvC (AmiA/AmiB activator)
MKEILREKEEEIKKLKSDLSLVIKERDDNIKQNKKLKSDLAFERTMLDNVSAEYESSQDVIKKLQERIRFLEQCLDNKEKVNKSLREENKRLSDFLECES